MDNHLFVSKYQLELPKKEEMQQFLAQQMREVGNSFRYGQSFYDQRPHGEDHQFHWLENVCCQQDACCSDFGPLTNIRFSVENRGKFTLNRFRIGNYS